MSRWPNSPEILMPTVAADSPYMRTLAGALIAEAGRVVDQPLTRQQAHERLMTVAQRVPRPHGDPVEVPERARLFIDGLQAGLMIGFHAGQRAAS